MSGSEDSESNSPPRKGMRLDETTPEQPRQGRRVPPRRMTVSVEEPTTSTAGWNDPPAPSSPRDETRPYKMTRRIAHDLLMPLFPPGPTPPSPPDEIFISARSNILSVISSLGPEEQEMATRTMRSFDPNWGVASPSVRSYVLDVSRLVRSRHYVEAQQLNDEFANSACFFSMLFKSLMPPGPEPGNS